MMERFILALDQGTTSSRAILFNHAGQSIGQLNQELPQIYPQPGWVEHDPTVIWESQIDVARQLLAQTGIQAEQVAAIGVTNQRETTIVWDAETGIPVHNAIVWQCRRTAGYCEELKSRGWADRVRAKTGLVLDAYFSGTKLKWILDHVPGARGLAEAGRLRFGTVDTWLIWNLTGGRVHVTDYSNASRTMLFNIHTFEWDTEILAELGIPLSMLPEVRPSSAVYGMTEASVLGSAIPIAGDAGDQQAALFGQTCFDAGDAKNTYGTGCFMLMNTGERPVASHKGLLTTIAWNLGGQVTYALEGSVFAAGATVQWLRDELQIIKDAGETEGLANSIPDNGGVYLVPAFVGLGAPDWDQYARGIIVGLTRGSGRAHIARAALEAMCYQTRGVLDAMQADAGIRLHTLRVDGGAVRNNFLVQFQSDILGVPVERPCTTETSALGAAYLAGLAVGFWQSQDELRANRHAEKRFTPSMAETDKNRYYTAWQWAVDRSRGWAAPASE